VGPLAHFYYVVLEIMSGLVEKLDKMIAPVVISMNLNYWGSVLVTEDGRSILRVFVDKEGGVGVDDCVAVSRSLGALFDVEEPLSASYSLEVSSPGIDRLLLRREHYEAYVMQNIIVRLYEGMDNKRKLPGVLTEVTADGIVLRSGETEYTIKFNQIKRANLNS
jgi:ribosome maturation factor RimP